MNSAWRFRRSLAGAVLCLAVVGASDDRQPLSVPPPRDLAATAGSGALRVFATDEKGDFVARGTPPNATLVEELRSVRWIVCVGTYDHRAARAAMRPTFAERSKEKYPIYRRLEIERQEQAADGGWSGWKSLDTGPTERILGYITEIEPEERLARVIVEPLATALPFLEKGTWQGAGVSKLELSDEQMKARGSNVRPRNDLGFLVADEPELLVRFFDFGVEPSKMYRYRCRVVFEDPRHPWPSRRELVGPWSDPTNAARVTE